MKTLDTFISNLRLYNSLPDNIKADVHDLAPLFRTNLAAILQKCKVEENAGFYGDAHSWTFEADVQHPELLDNESVVFGLNFDRESSEASLWAYIQKDGEQVEDTYELHAPDTEAFDNLADPKLPSPEEVVLGAVRNYGKLKEKTQKTPGDCVRLTVTDVQVYPFAEGPSLGHLRGYASITLNHQLQVRGLRIMEGENGLLVGYPVDPFYKGDDFREFCRPLTKELRDHIQEAVLAKYRELV
jgi:stage V sporulation protein G